MATPSIWWLFQEGGGLAAADAEGNLDLTSAGTPEWGVGPVADASMPYAYSNDDNSNYWQAAADALLQFGTDDFSISGWIYVTEETPGNENSIIDCREDNTHRYFLYYNGTVNSLAFTVNGGSNNGSHYSTTTVPLNTWTHFVLTVDRGGGSSYTPKIYLNGVDTTLVDGSGPSPITSQDISPAADADIGIDYAHSAAGNMRIASLRIYNGTALNQTEVDADYGYDYPNRKGIQYALEITTDATTVTDTDYGCVSGVFRFITGRPEYDGSAPYPAGESGVTTDTLQAAWYEGWIVKDGIANPSRQIDIADSGDYGTLSGLNFKLVQSKATDEFWAFIEANDIYLINRTVQLYVVIDGIFYFAWNGAISNNPYNTTEYTFQCQDTFRSIHKEIPPYPITEDNNPGAADDSTAEPVPIALGDIQYANLYNITGDPEWLKLMTLSKTGGLTQDYTSCPLMAAVPQYNSLRLYTPNRGHYLADTNLVVGNYLFIVKGLDIANKDYGYEIREVMWDGGRKIFPGLDDFAIYVRTYDNVGIDDILTGYNAEVYPIVGLQTPSSTRLISADPWWVRIGKLSIEYQISAGQVSSILSDANGDPILYNHTEDGGYSQINYVLSAVSLADGILTLRSNRQITLGGEIRYITPVPFDVQYEYDWGWLISNSSEYMYDRRRDTYTIFPEAGIAGDEINLYTWEIAFSDDVDYSNFDGVYVGVDLTTIANDSYRWKLELNYVDQIGNAIEEDSTIMYYPDGNSPWLQAGTRYDNLIHTDYYNGQHTNDEIDMFFNYVNAIYNQGSDPWYTFKAYTDAPTIRSYLEVPSAVFEDLKIGLQRKLVCTLSIVPENGSIGTCEVHLKQFGCFGISKQELIGENLFVGVSGEYGADYDTTNVYGVFRHIMEYYDGIDPGDIDYGNLATTRADWHVGRQITERKSSFDYLKMLAKQSFVAITPGRDGKRRLTAWLEDTTSPNAFTEINIVRDSIRDMKLTPLNKVYTDAFVQYHWDQGRKKYLRSYFITNADEDAFPGFDDDTWKTYAGGFDENGYADAKALWELAHDGYVRINAITPALPDNLSKLYYYCDATSIGKPEYGGTNSSAYKYLLNLMEWTKRQKYLVNFTIPLTSTSITYELMKKSTFSDDILTDGTAWTGYITKWSLNTKDNSIDITMTVEPSDYEATGGGLIIERGQLLNEDTITERGDQGDDTITETGV